jgi:hypothetical protein
MEHDYQCRRFGHENELQFGSQSTKLIYKYTCTCGLDALWADYRKLMEGER